MSINICTTHIGLFVRILLRDYAHLGHGQTRLEYFRGPIEFTCSPYVLYFWMVSQGKGKRETVFSWEAKIWKSESHGVHESNDFFHKYHGAGREGRQRKDMRILLSEDESSKTTQYTGLLERTTGRLPHLTA